MKHKHTKPCNQRRCKKTTTTTNYSKDGRQWETGAGGFGLSKNNAGLGQPVAKAGMRLHT